MSWTFVSQQRDKRDQSTIQPDWPSAIWTTSRTVTVAAGSLFAFRVPFLQFILLVNMGSDYQWAWMRTHTGEGIHVLSRAKVSCLPRRGLVCVWRGAGGAGLVRQVPVHACTHTCISSHECMNTCEYWCQTASRCEGKMLVLKGCIIEPLVPVCTYVCRDLVQLGMHLSTNLHAWVGFSLCVFFSLCAGAKRSWWGW